MDTHSTLYFKRWSRYRNKRNHILIPQQSEDQLNQIAKKYIYKEYRFNTYKYHILMKQKKINAGKEMRCITHTRRQSILCTPIHLDCLLQLFQSLPIISCPGDKFQLCLSYKFILISNYLPNIYMNSNSDNEHFCLSCSVTPPLKNVYSI